MHNKKLKGFWSPELTQLETIKDQIVIYQSDLCSNQFGTPREFVQKITRQLAAIEKKIATNNKPHSFFNTRVSSLRQTLDALNSELAVMTDYLKESEKVASSITRKCATIIEHVATDYASADRDQSIFKKSIRFSKPTPFETIQNPGLKTWHFVKNKLAYFQSILSIDKRPNNSLANLLLNDDQQFLKVIAYDQLILEGEIGFLIVQRLQKLFYHSQSDIQTRKIAGKKLREIMAPSMRESLLYYNSDALMLEITKLALHARYHPTRKIIWLGTARAVTAMIESSTPVDAYFNPLPQHLTWILNRLWLQAAVGLGYHFKLIEQHFLNIEAALLTKNPAKFIEKLLLETRSDNEQNTSQYNGNFSPTATTQEVLALLDMGCIAHKDPVSHGISFTPPQMAYEEPLFSSLDTISSFFKQNPQSTPSHLYRPHSFSELDKASQPPPYKNLIENFITPTTGELVEFNMPKLSIRL